MPTHARIDMTEPQSFRYTADYSYLLKTADEVHTPIRRLKNIIKSSVYIYLPLGLRPGQTLLDVGASIGTIGHYLKFGGIQSVSLDLNEAAVQKGIDIFGDEKNNKRLVADASNIPYSSQSFDVVFSQDLFEHMPTETVASQVFTEMERLCKRGKMLHKITTLDNLAHIHADDSHFLKWSIIEWEIWFRSKGWDVSHPSNYLISLLNKMYYSNKPYYNEELFLLKKTDVI